MGWIWTYNSQIQASTGTPKALLKRGVPPANYGRRCSPGICISN